MNVRVIQICDGSYVGFFFFHEFFLFLAVIGDRLAAVHLRMAITTDKLVVGNQATGEGNQDTTEVDIQVAEEGIQGIVEVDIQVAVVGSQGTIEEDIQPVVDILATVEDILDIIGIHMAMAWPSAKVLPFST